MSDRFDKEEYWRARNAKPEDRKMARRVTKARFIVAVHSKPDWPSKLVSKKAARKHTKRWRKAQLAA